MEKSQKIQIQLSRIPGARERAKFNLYDMYRKETALE